MKAELSKCLLTMVICGSQTTMQFDTWKFFIETIIYDTHRYELKYMWIMDGPPIIINHVKRTITTDDLPLFVRICSTYERYEVILPLSGNYPMVYLLDLSDARRLFRGQKSGQRCILVWFRGLQNTGSMFEVRGVR